jgi:branched-chain amino acid transport system substrate-binding protein
MKKGITILIIVLLFLGLFWLNGSNNRDKKNEPIKIGASLSLTGVAADFGEMSKLAMEMAVEEINTNGGIDGRQVVLLIEDDQTTAQGGLSAYQKLVGVENVDALVGGLFDFTAKPVFPLAQKDKKVFVSPINFEMKTFEMNDYSFVMYPRFEDVVLELESVIKEKNIKNLAMIRFESGFSEAIQDTLIKIMNNVGDKPLYVETYKAIGSSDFRTNILKLKNNNPEAVFLDMLDFDIIKYLSIAENLDFHPQIIAYTTLRDVLNNDEVDKTKLEGAIMLDWEVSSNEFAKRFQEKYGILPRRGAERSYDAVYVLAEAIAKSDNPENVASYMENNTFKTIGGEIEFTDKHAVKSIPVKVFEVEKGDLIEIKNSK